MAIAIKHSGSLFDPQFEPLPAELNQHRGWYTFEALAFIGLGLLAASLPLFTTLAVEAVVGILLLVGGVARLANTFRFRAARLWRAISGVIFATGGILILWMPQAGFLSLVMAVAILLLAEGIIETFIALAYRPSPQWGWLLLSGIISLFLGAIIAAFPPAGLFYIGFFVGLSMAVYGMAMMMLVVKSQSA